MNLSRQAVLRWEQFRQARRIHGGLIGWCIALIGVQLARVPIPSRRLRERLFRKIFGGKYRGIDESEIDRPLGDFRSLNELFTRGVSPDRRPVSDESDVLVSPCDAVVQDVGRLQGDTILTVKSIRYSLASLTPGWETSRFVDGAFAILFLSPVDCHRIFAPSEGCIRETLHVPGRRLLVHPPFQREEFPVFALNERVAFRGETDGGGEYLLVMVAGWGVGNISYPPHMLGEWAKRLKSRRRVTQWRSEPGERVHRGQWLATFELGSTVILIASPELQLKPRATRDQVVRYGQALFSKHQRGDA